MRRAILVLGLLALTLTGCGVVRQLLVAPSPSPAEELARMQQMMTAIQALQPAQAQAGPATPEPPAWSEHLREIYGILRELHGKQVEHNFRLRQLEERRP